MVATGADDVFELGKALIDHSLKDGAFFRQDLFGQFFSAHHVLELAALGDVRPYTHLVHQAAVIIAVEDHTDAAGHGQLIGHNPTAGGADIITTRGCQRTHGSDDGDVVFFLKLLEQQVDLIAGQHFATR